MSTPSVKEPARWIVRACIGARLTWIVATNVDAVSLQHPYRTRLRLGGDAWAIFEVLFAPVSLQSSLQRAKSGRIRRDATDANPHMRRMHGLAKYVEGSYTIFEGTSEIQRLVIARAISGMHIR
jgi:hypothetical protein